MNPNLIVIEPVSIWTSTGVKTAVGFNVRYVNFNGVTAIADCQLLDAAGTEVSSQLVNATAQQCANWGEDNVPFYKELAQNAGLTPV